MYLSGNSGNLFILSQEYGRINMSVNAKAFIYIMLVYIIFFNIKSLK